jgi:hypothetical protein
MADHSAKLDALKQLSTVLTKKDTPEDDLWTKAGVKKGERLKKVNDEIVKVKKLVSTQTKRKVDEELAKDDEEQGKTGKSDKFKDDGNSARQAGRDKKMMSQAANAGEFDMVTDHVFTNGDGEVAYME